MTDKEQPDQNCCKWMKDHWLDIVMILLLFSLLIFLIWQCNWLLEPENRHVIRTLVFACSTIGAIYGLTLLIRRHCLEGVLVIFASLITALATCLWELLTGQGGEAGPTIRTLVLIYAALGAFYGLSLGARRLKATEKQLKISEAGLFNDRLGRGVELLNSNNLYSRTAGIRILEDLYKTVELANQKLIRESLLDFIRGRSPMHLPKEQQTLKEARKDIGNAIKLLGELVSGKTILPKEKRAELDMQGLELHGLNLSQANLQRANFGGTYLQNTDFQGANLQNVDLTETYLENAENLIQEQLNKAIYEKGKLPKLDKGLTIPENRAYEWVKDENGNMRRRIIATGQWID